MFVGVSCDSLTYFGDLLHWPYKRIVTITKVYIATKNIQSAAEIVREIMISRWDNGARFWSKFTFDLTLTHDLDI